MFDFTKLEPGEHPAPIHAEMGIGEVLVIVPKGMPVSVHAEVGAGSIRLLDQPQQGGVGFEASAQTEGVDPIVIDVSAGIGTVEMSWSVSAGPGRHHRSERGRNSMKRHRFDPFAFLFGAVFLTIGLTVATGGSGVDAVRPFRSWPSAVILTGVVLVVWTVSRVVRSLSGEEAESLAEGAPGAAADEAVWADGPEATETNIAELDETPPP